MRSVIWNNPLTASHGCGSRNALTLAEVLIAMGILTLGLLGVASVFPVGGHYMQTGDIADRAGSIAQAALEDAIIRGHLDPENWVVHDGSIAGTTNSQFISFLDGDGALRPGLRQALASLGAVRKNPANPAPVNALTVLGQSQRQAGTPERYIPKFLGGAIVLDPIGLAGVLTQDGYSQAVRTQGLTFSVRRFPASAPDAADAWPDWAVGPYQWPVRRATPIHTVAALNSNVTFNRQLAIAQEQFTAADDVSQTLPDNGDRPARGLWEDWRSGSLTGLPSSRLSNGDFSWIITVAPGSAKEFESLAFQPDAYPMEVSAVVFHKREIPRGRDGALGAERLVRARIVSTGPSGGEVLLEKRAVENSTGSPLVNASPFENLRTGAYVMVVGPHPLTSSARPMLALRWCRVVNIEDTGYHTLNGARVQLGKTDTGERTLVALRGPDWPWRPAANLNTDALLSNDLRVVIVPGAVAVHTKTMRLEAGSEWSIR